MQSSYNSPPGYSPAGALPAGYGMPPPGGYGGGGDFNHFKSRIAVNVLDRIEFVAYMILFFQFSTALVALLLTDPTDLESESALARYLWYPGYALIFLVTLRRLPHVLRIAALNPLLLLCIIWCGLSVMWSVDPAISFRRVIALTVTTLFGLALAARYSWNAMIQRLAFMFAILAVMSLFVSLFIPSLGVESFIEDHIGAWRGLWVQKNYTGGAMTKGLLLMMCAFAMRPDRAWFWLPMGLLCFFLVIMSQSKTALLVSTILIGGFITIRIFRRYPLIRIPLMYIVLLSTGLFVTLMLTIPDDVLGLIGKDATFTGRTDIWNELIRSIKDRPWIGYGYGVYWMDPLGPSYYVRAVLEWGVPSAHNGWFETILSAGLVAGILFGVLYVITLLLAINRMGRGGVESYWAILSTLMFLLFSLSESTILQQNDLTWVMFVATSAKLFANERPYWRHTS